MIRILTDAPACWGVAGGLAEALWPFRSWILGVVRDSSHNQRCFGEKEIDSSWPIAFPSHDWYFSKSTHRIYTQKIPKDYVIICMHNFRGIFTPNDLKTLCNSGTLSTSESPLGVFVPNRWYHLWFFQRKRGRVIEELMQETSNDISIYTVYMTNYDLYFVAA